MLNVIRRIISHPLTCGLDLDDPSTAAIRRRVIEEKPFLRQLYCEWYGAIRRALPAVPGAVLEVGSAGGFVQNSIPEALRSDVFVSDGVDIVLDSRRLPMAENSLRAIVMTNVFHHIPDVERFLGESQCALSQGGRIIMWEPWVTPWSQLIYRYIHHEPCDPDASSWAFPEGGPLSSANEALPWIVFARDAEHFKKRFADLEILELRLAMPLCYLISGGVSFRSFLPGFAYRTVRAFEQLLSPLDERLAMFAFIVIEKRTH